MEICIMYFFIVSLIRCGDRMLLPVKVFQVFSFNSS